MMLHRGVILLVTLFGATQSKVISGTIESFSNFYFLDRFCFSPHNGKATFQFKYRRENVKGFPTYNSLLMYWDGADQWDSAYNTNILSTCEEKVQILLDHNELDQVAVLKQTEEGYCSQENNTLPWINCTSYIGFQNSRARWWYFVISNCDNPNGVTKMDYKVELTNGNSFWTKHVSADEIGILETEIVFLCLLLYLVITSARVASVLAKRQLYHTSYKLYISSLILQVLSTMIKVVFRVLVNAKGEKNIPLEYISKGLACLSHTTFVLLLILLAKGWTVVKGRLSTQGTMAVSVSITIYLISKVIALFWEVMMFDPGKVIYEYESIPGYFVIICITLVWMWFVKCNVYTWKVYPEKNTFYLMFFITYTIWFLAKPVIVLVAAFKLEDHYREKIVNVVVNTNILFGYSVFLILTRPSAANKSFPFHVRTSQIGVSASAAEEVIDDQPKRMMERASMFRATGPITNGRSDAYSVGFSSINSNNNCYEMQPSHI